MNGTGHEGLQAANRIAVLIPGSGHEHAARVGALLAALTQGEVRPGCALVVLDHPDQQAAHLQTWSAVTPWPVIQAETDTPVLDQRVHLVPAASTENMRQVLAALADQYASGMCVVVLEPGNEVADAAVRTCAAMGILTIGQVTDPAGDSTDLDTTGGAVVPDVSVEDHQVIAHLDRWLRADGPVLDQGSLAAWRLVVRQVLAAGSDIDTSAYTDATLRRQVMRRMLITGHHQLQSYLQHLSSDPGETAALTSSLLVGVTRFFRDPEVFEALEQALVTHFAERPAASIRIWVPGCSTGQEAYTVAMIAAHAAGATADVAGRIKVLATDINTDSLRLARAGTYPATALDQIPERYAWAHNLVADGRVQMVEHLRNALVFAKHNITSDVPFAHIDLLSFRNTLIYFTPSTQHSILDTLTYALNPGGLLLLGTAEQARSSGLDTINQAARLYRRNTTRLTRPALTTPQGRARAELVGPTLPTPGADTARRMAALEVLARDRAHPCVLLDQRQEILEIVGDVSAYCRLEQGAPSLSVMSILRPELTGPARAALLLSSSSTQPVASEEIDLADGGSVQLVATPQRSELGRLCVLEFRSTQPLEPAAVLWAGTRPVDFDSHIHRLETELLANQEVLQQSLADLEAANEELLASSEQLQSTTEQLQGSYEELTMRHEALWRENDALRATIASLRGSPGSQ